MRGKWLHYVHFSKADLRLHSTLQIFQGIVHHCLESKSLKCVFAFAYCSNNAGNTDDLPTANTVRCSASMQICVDSLELCIGTLK